MGSNVVPQKKLRILTIPLNILTVLKVQEMCYRHPTIRIYLTQDNFIEGVLEDVICDSSQLLLKNATHFYSAMKMFHTHSSINVIFDEIMKFEILTRNEYIEFVNILTTEHPGNLHSQLHSPAYQLSEDNENTTEEILSTVVEATDQTPVNNFDLNNYVA